MTWNKMTDREQCIFKNAVKYEILLAANKISEHDMKKMMIYEFWMHDRNLSLNDMPDEIYFDLKEKYKGV